MAKIDLDFCEFYITNVCNLTCENCNRFNNFDVKGRVEFKEDLYKPWADQINFGHIGIIGGEPLLHPNLTEWVQGIRKLWPEPSILVTSNGTRLNKVKNLFEVFSQNNAQLEISFHDAKIDEYIWNEINTFKQSHGTNWIETKEPFQMPDRDGNPIYLLSHKIKCDEGFVFVVTDAHYFQENQFNTWINEKPLPYNSDPKEAHYACGMKNSHTFYDGKLYKCGFIPSVQQYLEQNDVNEHWEKVYEYIPHYDITDISRIKDPEQICSLCPPTYHFDKVKTSFK